MKYIFILLMLCAIPSALQPQQISKTILMFHSLSHLLTANSSSTKSDKKSTDIPSGRKESKITRANRNGKWGYVDENGRTVLPFQYDEAEDFKSSGNKFIAKVRIRNFWIFIDINGKTVNPIEEFDSRSGTPLDHINNIRKNAQRDISGELKGKGFDEVIDGGLYKVVRIRDKYGLIDHYGKMIRGIQYDDIKVYGYVIILKYKGKFGLYQLFEEEIPSIYDELVPIFYKNKIDNQNKFFIVKLNGKYGVIAQKNHREVIPIINDEITPIIESDQSAYVALRIKLGGKYGLSSWNGGQSLPVIYDEITAHTIHSKSCIVRRGAKYGLVNYLGAKILPGEYDRISIASAITPLGWEIYEIQRGDRFGLVDHRGEKVIPMQNDVNDFNRRKIALYEKYKKYQPVEFYPALGLNKIKEKDKNIFGIFSIDGREIIPAKYITINPLLSGTRYHVSTPNGTQKIIDDKDRDITGEFGHISARELMQYKRVASPTPSDGAGDFVLNKSTAFEGINFYPYGTRNYYLDKDGKEFAPSDWNWASGYGFFASIGPSVSFTPKFAAGGEASLIMHSTCRSGFGGIYTDFLHEFDTGRNRLTVGPEFGFSAFFAGLGVDGGLVLSRESGRTYTGQAVRPFVFLGNLMFYARFMKVREPGGSSKIVEFGISVKFPFRIAGNRCEGLEEW